MQKKYKQNLYQVKNKKYFSNVRFDIVDLIPQNQNNKILEIGCGSGVTLLTLKKMKKAAYVVGIDIIDLDQQDVLDVFLCCDIEKEIYSLPFPKNFFDVIIYGDVLEHLVDPWSVLKESRSYLKKGGLVVASMPNIREIKTLVNICLKGDFRYEEEGILDKTHLRFFCKKNIIELFEEAGFVIKKISYNLSTKRSILNKVLLGVFEEFLVSQYIILASNEK